MLLLLLSPLLLRGLMCCCCCRVWFLDDSGCPQLGLIKLDWPVTCVTFCESGMAPYYSMLLIGTSNGHIGELMLLPKKAVPHGPRPVKLKLVRSWHSPLNKDQEITALQCSPCGRWIGAATSAGGIEVFAGRGLQHLWRADGHSARVQR